MWPQSLVTRMTMLVVAVGVLSLGLHVLVLGLWFEPLSEDLASGLTGRVQLTRKLLQAAHPAGRDIVAAEVGGGRYTVSRLSAPLDSPRDAPVPAAVRMLSALRERAGPEITVNLAPIDQVEERGTIYFDFQVANENWRATYRANPPILALLSTGLGWFVLVALAVIASLVVGVRSIARPLSEFARQLAAQGDMLHQLPTPARTSRELKTLTDSFNHLVDKVQRADEVKQQMLAGVSHDLRTPLARLRLRIEMECAEPLADILCADLHAIERIVSQFLAYVQGNNRAGLGESESITAVVSQVIAGYVLENRPVYSALGDVDLEVPDLGLQRALRNLIDNALSHGAPPVEVELIQRATKSGAEMALTVWDHGAGLTGGEFLRAQLPFVRLGNASVDLGHCGLGLAIVSQIAGQMQAKLEQVRDGQGRFGISIVWLLAERAGKIESNIA
jgi:two-component system, OmpR family, osmolarity sensor histidine kinase EnvZ